MRLNCKGIHKKESEKLLEVKKEFTDFNILQMYVFVYAKDGFYISNHQRMINDNKKDEWTQPNWFH